MRLYNFSRLTAASAAVALFLSAVPVVYATGIVPTGQVRSVTAHATAVYYNHAVTTANQGFSAPDFLPFVQTASATASDTLATGTGTALQQSSFVHTCVIANGTATFLCTGYGHPTPHVGIATADSSSSFSLTFQLAEATEVSLTGQLSLDPAPPTFFDGWATTNYTLKSAGSVPYVTYSGGELHSTFSIPPSPPTLAIDEHMTLPAGTFQLKAWANVNGRLSSDVSAFSRATTQFALDLQVVPEPTGAVAIAVVAGVAGAVLATHRRKLTKPGPLAAAVLCVLAASAPTGATITPTGQVRYVSANASAVYRDHVPSTGSRSFAASDFSAFQQTASAFASDTICSGTGTGRQNSWFSDSRVLAEGTVSFQFTSYPGPAPYYGVATARGSSSFELTFQLEQATDMTLTGGLSIDPPPTPFGVFQGTTRYSLYSTAAPVTTFAVGSLSAAGVPPSPPSLAINEMLTLPAGSYTLTGSALVNASFRSDVGPLGRATATFALDLRVVPEAFTSTAIAAVVGVGLARRPRPVGRSPLAGIGQRG